MESKRKIEPVTEPPKRVRLPEKLDSNEWISAGKTRNYMLNDPILDWLNLYGDENDLHRDKEEAFQGKILENLFSRGKIFETNVINFIKDNFPKGCIVQIIKDEENAPLESLKLSKYNLTLEEMKKGTYVIYQGVLRNHENKTFGIPDLLIRSDFLCKIIHFDHLTDQEKVIPAANLGGNYHYICVDIKNVTLRILADRKSLASGDYNPFKAQICVYNEALGEMQGYKPPRAYILGRKWILEADQEFGLNFTERLGVVDFEGRDSDVITKTREALNWIRDVRNEGRKWAPWNPQRKEMYPNMSNVKDFPWHTTKSRIAEEISELTMIGGIGYAAREKFHEHNMYSWKDHRFDARVIYKNPGVEAKCIQCIVDINKSQDIILPKVISTDIGEWKTPRKVELFVDFETASDMVAEISSTSIANTLDIIYMIGVGYVNANNEWVYTNFTVGDFSQMKEYYLIEEFYKYIRSFGETPRLFHYGSHEKSEFRKAVERYEIFNQQLNTVDDMWYDIEKNIIKAEPVVIKDCFDFSLKSIVAAMNFHKLISIGYGRSKVLDGQEAMMLVAAENSSLQPNETLSQRPVVKDIIDYNEIDCRTMYEILIYLRKNHTG